jgi:hypothetical protein
VLAVTAKPARERQEPGPARPPTHGPRSASGAPRRRSEAPRARSPSERAQARETYELTLARSAREYQARPCNRCPIRLTCERECPRFLQYITYGK